MSITNVNVSDYILRDEATLAELGVNSAADIVKGLISLVGATAAIALLPATATVLATGLTFAFASFAIGEILGLVDKNTGFSEDITKAVERYFE